MGEGNHVALYRRYRSRGFDDVVGQEHVTKTLAGAVKAGRVVHAYLFTGPHGVGKTSVARILARAVNDVDYDSDAQHLDIIEIDAASNRGIDEVRELREKALLSPSSAKYKVYIIDEVHMLTPPAFNALLKLLEEPPAHAIFILATTEAHKVPATIRSRSQWYGFRPIDEDQIAKRLEFVAKSEKIKLSPGAAKLIAKQGRGSLRDSIGLLDQLSSETRQIDEASVVKLLGLIPDELIANIMSALDSADVRGLKSQLQSAHESGFSPRQLASQLVEQIQSQTPTTTRLNLIERLLSVGPTSEPRLMLEVVLLKYAVAKQPSRNSEPVKPKPSTNETSADAFDQQWPQVLADIKERNNSLYAVLRLAQPALEEDTLKLHFGFDFHKQRLDEERNRQTVAKAVNERLGRSVSIVSLVAPPAEGSPVPEPQLDQVISVMGGGELGAYEDEI